MVGPREAADAERGAVVDGGVGVEGSLDGRRGHGAVDALAGGGAGDGDGGHVSLVGDPDGKRGAVLHFVHHLRDVGREVREREAAAKQLLQVLLSLGPSGLSLGPSGLSSGLSGLPLGGRGVLGLLVLQGLLVLFLVHDREILGFLGGVGESNLGGDHGHVLILAGGEDVLDGAVGGFGGLERLGDAAALLGDADGGADEARGLDLDGPDGGDVAHLDGGHVGDLVAVLSLGEVHVGDGDGAGGVAGGEGTGDGAGGEGSVGASGRGVRARDLLGLGLAERDEGAAVLGGDLGADNLEIVAVARREEVRSLILGGGGVLVSLGHLDGVADDHGRHLGDGEEGVGGGVHGLALGAHLETADVVDDDVLNRAQAELSPGRRRRGGRRRGRRRGGGRGRRGW